MIKATSIDRSRRLDIYARFNEVFERTFAVNNADATPFDFAGEGFTDAVLYVYKTTDGKRPVLSAPVLTLNVADGVTLTEGFLSFTSTNEVRFSRDQYIYYLWLINAEGSKLWLNGLVIMNHGLYDGVTETDEIIVNPDGENVTIEVVYGTETGIETPEELLSLLGQSTPDQLESIALLLAPYLGGVVPSNAIQTDDGITITTDDGNIIQTD